MLACRCKRESIDKIENAQKELAYQWEQAQNAHDLGESIQYKEAIAKIKKLEVYLRKAEKVEKFYVEDPAHHSFSGSLVFRKGQNNSYDVYGIYSGPLFTQEIKDFIENAAALYHEEKRRELRKARKVLKRKKARAQKKIRKAQDLGELPF
jgi:triosephosphate isomerase